MLEKLIEYQSVDAELRKLEQELLSNEDRKKGISAKKFLDTVNDSLAELDAKAAELDSAYTKYVEIHARLAETQKDFDQSVLDDYTEENELAFVKKKAQELMDELKNLERQLVRLNDEIVVLTEKYSQLKKKTFAAQKQFKESGQKYTEYKATLAKPQKEIADRLAVMEKDVDPQLMALYKKKRADKMFPIFFEYTGTGFCPHCRTEISKLAESTIAKDKIITCENCGRVMYMTDKPLPKGKK